MKTKKQFLFLLLLGLLSSVGNVWGADVAIFSWTSKTGIADADISAGNYNFTSANPGNWLKSLNGGTVQMVVPSNGNMRVRGSQLAYNSNNSYFIITLDNALAEGDKIDINSSGNTNNIYISLSTTRPSSDSKATAIIVQGTTYTIPKGNDLIGENVIYVWRKSSTTQLGTFTITRASTKTAISEVLKSSSAVKVGSSTLTKDVLTNGYSVDDATITITDDIDYISTPTNIKLVKTITYNDDSSADEDVDVTFDGSIDGGYYIGTASIGLTGSVTNYTVKVKQNATPTITLSGDAGSITLKSYEPTGSVKVTVSGANLTGATFTAPTVDGVTITPASATITDGAFSQEFTITTTATTASSTVITFSHTGATSKTYTLSYSKTAQRSLSQVNVSSATTWDWSKAYNSANVQLTASTSPTKSEEFLLSNIAEVKNDANFNAQALKVIAEYATRKEGSSYFMQGNSVKFTTTVPGILDVDFSNTGGSRPYRYLRVNGELTSYKSGDGTKVSATGISVPAGDVVIDFYIPNASDPQSREGDNVGVTMCRVMKIVFTPVTSISATIGATEWGTLVSNYALDFSESAVKAYLVKGHDGNAITKAQMTGTVPAGTPLLLNATEGNYEIPVVASSSTDVSGNLLKAGTGEEVTAEGGKTKYVLAAVEDVATFLRINETPATVPVGKAYLEFNEEIAGAPALRIVEENQDATGIDDIEASEKAIKFIENGRILIKKNGIVYDALGRIVK